MMPVSRLKIRSFGAVPGIGLVLVLLFLVCKTNAQPPAFKMLSYIENYSEEAVRQMVMYKIPASITLAQAILESSNGESELAKKSNNHFGIKCHMEWGGDTVIKHDDTLNECFRKYLKIEDSYTDHSLFLASRARYAPLFELPLNDYKAWCVGLKTSGYATYGGYADDLIDIIERAKLYELDGYECLKPFNAFELAHQNILPVPPPDYFCLFFSDFCRADLLWIEERDMLVQSLDLLTQTEEQPENKESAPYPTYHNFFIKTRR
ncbi:MAG TPA: glucosaminidase domain-containing protein [Bacteroidia bacterium]|nr:glucosaminidase domain-containing protein [Bacteroidia bacterium]